MTTTNKNKLYKSLIDWIYSRIPEGIKGEGVGDSKVNQLTLAKIAGCFADAVREGRIRFYRNSEVVAYDGRMWVHLDLKTDLNRVINGTLEKLGVGDVYRMPSQVNVTREKILQDFQVGHFNPQRRYVVCDNVVLDMRSGERHEFDEKFQTNIRLNVKYDPEAKCELWDKTLTETVQDWGAIQFMQEFLGAIFIDKTELKIEVCLHLVGGGSNGKSVVYETMKALFGDYASSASISNLTTHQNSAYYRAEIAGKLLNYCSELDKKDFSNGDFKGMVSRESLTARVPCCAPFEYSDWPSFMTNLNNMFIVTDQSDGFWRRNRFIPFTRVFTEEEQDKNLAVKLESELSGILNWILEGRRRLVENKGVFTRSAVMEELHRKARLDSSPILGWIEENRYIVWRKGMNSGKGGVEMRRIHLSSLYESYVKYCELVGASAKKQANFSNELKAAGHIYRANMKIAEVNKSGFEMWVNTAPTIDLENIEDEESRQMDLPF